jgi:hypothetical protein
MVVESHDALVQSSNANLVRRASNYLNNIFASRVSIRDIPKERLTYFGTGGEFKWAMGENTRFAGWVGWELWRWRRGFRWVGRGRVL